MKDEILFVCIGCTEAKLHGTALHTAPPRLYDRTVMPHLHKIDLFDHDWSCGESEVSMPNQPNHLISHRLIGYLSRPLAASKSLLHVGENEEFMSLQKGHGLNLNSAALTASAMGAGQKLLGKFHKTRQCET